MVRKRGGFTLILDYQLYPFGFHTRAKKIQDELDLPVDCPRSLSDQTTKRFLDWHQRRRRIDRIHTYLKDKLPGAQIGDDPFGPAASSRRRAYCTVRIEHRASRANLATPA